jgi:hypothetical protein
MLYSLIYWECPKLKIITLNMMKGCHKRSTRMSEAKTKTNLKKQDKRICAGIMYLRSARWRIPQKAINFPTSFSRNTLCGIKLRVPVLLLSRFCMVWDTVIKTADTGAEYRQNLVSADAAFVQPDSTISANILFSNRHSTLKVIDSNQF